MTDMTLGKCYQIATSELRDRHHEEFHEILADVYRRYNIAVKPRGSRKQQRAKKIERTQEYLKTLTD